MAQNIEPIISVRDVHKWYGQYHALRGINLEIERGETIVVFGPSGSGKSTFIRTGIHSSPLTFVFSIVKRAPFSSRASTSPNDTVSIASASSFNNAGSAFAM